MARPLDEMAMQYVLHELGLKSEQPISIGQLTIKAIEGQFEAATLLREMETLYGSYPAYVAVQNAKETLKMVIPKKEKSDG